MSDNLRVFGWLLVGMGTVLATITALGLIGAMQVHVSVWGNVLESRSEQTIFALVWLIAAFAGALLLRVTRERSAAR